MLTRAGREFVYTVGGKRHLCGEFFFFINMKGTTSAIYHTKYNIKRRTIVPSGRISLRLRARSKEIIKLFTAAAAGNYAAHRSVGSDIITG